MRCWIVHRFGKWKAYTAEYESSGLEYSPVPELGMWSTTTIAGPRKFTEERQRRECLNCGYTQDRRISEK
jgi:hypothetical protein